MAINQKKLDQGLLNKSPNIKSRSFNVFNEKDSDYAMKRDLDTLTISTNDNSTLHSFRINESAKKLNKESIEIDSKEESNSDKSKEENINTELWYELEKQSNITSQVKKKFVKIIIICAIFICVEIIGGVLANSIAIMADASHLACDLTGFS